MTPPKKRKRKKENKKKKKTKKKKQEKKKLNKFDVKNGKTVQDQTISPTRFPNFPALSIVEIDEHTTV